MLKLETHNSPTGVLLGCSGQIFKADGADELRRAVMSQDSRHIQIDLSHVNAIDAGGLGVLAELARWARDSDRTIQLLNPAKMVRDALDTTHLSSVLQIRIGPRSRGEAA